VADRAANLEPNGAAPPFAAGWQLGVAFVVAIGVGSGVSVAETVVGNRRVVVKSGCWGRGGVSVVVVGQGGSGPGACCRLDGLISVASRLAFASVASDVAGLALRRQSLVLHIVFSALPPSQVIALLAQSSPYWYFRPEGWVRVGGPSNLAISSKRTGSVTKVAWALPASAVALCSFVVAGHGTGCC
jgi:hypothetical protein